MRKFALFSAAARAVMAGGVPSEDEDPAGEAGPAPTPAPPVDPEDPDSQPTPAPAEQPETPSAGALPPEPAANVDQARAEAAEAGALAERQRVEAVFQSEAALANPALAAWMIVHAPQADAEAIVAQLKTAPVTPAASSAPAAQTIPATNLNLGATPPATAAGEDEPVDPWAHVLEPKPAANGAPVVPAANASVDNTITVPAGMITRTGN